MQSYLVNVKTPAEMNAKGSKKVTFTPTIGDKAADKLYGDTVRAVRDAFKAHGGAEVAGEVRAELKTSFAISVVIGTDEAKQAIEAISTVRNVAPNGVQLAPPVLISG